MQRNLAIICLVAAAVAVQSSCGGGSSRDTSSDVVVQATLVPLLDGCIYTNGITPTPLDNSPLSVAVGDYHWPGPVPAAAEYEIRGFVTFDISAVLPPPPAVVREATLTLYQWNVSGAPYGGGMYGNIILDHVNLGATLDTLDYNSAPLAGGSGFATLSTDIALANKAVDVRSQVGLNQVNGDAHVSFRLRFNSVPPSPMPSDGAHDMAQFEDAENNGGSGNLPVLTIRYTP